eukprot:361058-Chlamydomonas_euryale.AAC.2
MLLLGSQPSTSADYVHVAEDTNKLISARDCQADAAPAVNKLIGAPCALQAANTVADSKDAHGNAPQLRRRLAEHISPAARSHAARSAPHLGITLAECTTVSIAELQHSDRFPSARAPGRDNVDLCRCTAAAFDCRPCYPHLCGQPCPHFLVPHADGSPIGISTSRLTLLRARARALQHPVHASKLKDGSADAPIDSNVCGTRAADDGANT